ncbi:AraC-like DNA-binding protein [Paenibacillus phyllosphaerae]|uniref:AraC-like DNA-binding protein n=1 Tax=Paenibacillus phyllosphaerae TaxID=274593 RepID=A0A7W5B1T8_9BACL|nr:AraC family transcriptional regulator [Paenibacillus phyllosphaerae]MBB3112306.1 AraC-like DNA-binding protein [Paenibacillus phyllosphaerae]
MSPQNTARTAVTHEYYTNPDRPLSKAFFAFDGKQSMQLLGRIGLTPNQPHAAGAASQEAIAAMHELRARASEPALSDLSRLNLFYRLFDLLAMPQSASLHDGADQSPDPAWLQQGREYMDIHYAEGITIEHVAASVGIDRSHFTKTFRKRYEIPPMQYMLQLRMNEAQLLLTRTDYKLADIARSVGYPDLFSFSKAFKKRIGMPPQDYRLQAQAASQPERS